MFFRVSCSDSKTSLPSETSQRNGMGQHRRKVANSEFILAGFFPSMWGSALLAPSWAYCPWVQYWELPEPSRSVVFPTVLRDMYCQCCLLGVICLTRVLIMVRGGNSTVDMEVLVNSHNFPDRPLAEWFLFVGYWGFFPTPLFILLCCFCFTLRIRDG